jgi:hypothetical protein
MGADEQLLAAAKSGDVAAARAALDNGADKERKDEVRSLLTATQRTLRRPARALKRHAPRAARRTVGCR